MCQTALSEEVDAPIPYLDQVTEIRLDSFHTGWDATIRPNGAARLSAGSNDTAYVPAGTLPFEEVYNLIVSHLKPNIDDYNIPRIQIHLVTGTSPEGYLLGKGGGYIDDGEVMKTLVRPLREKAVGDWERFDVMFGNFSVLGDEPSNRPPPPTTTEEKKAHWRTYEDAMYDFGGVSMETRQAWRGEATTISVQRAMADGILTADTESATPSPPPATPPQSPPPAITPETPKPDPEPNVAQVSRLAASRLWLYAAPLLLLAIAAALYFRRAR